MTVFHTRHTRCEIVKRDPRHQIQCVISKVVAEHFSLSENYLKITFSDLGEYLAVRSKILRLNLLLQSQPCASRYFNW